MSEIISLIPRADGVTEGLYCTDNAAGKLIHSKDLGGLDEADDVLIVQHGLPGVEWRKAAEEKARALVQNRQDVAVILGIPMGIKENDKNLANKTLGVGEDLARIKAEFPDLFDKDFTLAGYLHGLSRLAKSARGDIREDCRLHLAGQSFGSLALLSALREMRGNGIAPPDSASFLAPFVSADRYAIQGTDEYALSMSNPHSKMSEVGRSAKLNNIYKECHDHYRVTEHVDLQLLKSHDNLFSKEFYDVVDDLHEFCRKTIVQIIRGEHDSDISDRHSALLKGRMDVHSELMLPESGHDLESLGFAQLLPDNLPGEK